LVLDPTMPSGTRPWGWERALDDEASLAQSWRPGLTGCSSVGTIYGLIRQVVNDGNYSRAQS
jgi:hypothetical protein